MLAMDLRRDVDDPFALAVDKLWEPSYFHLHELQPLDSLPWDDDLPELAQGVFQGPLDLFTKRDSNIYELNLFGTDALESTDPDTPLSLSTSQTDVDPNETKDETDETDEITDIWASDANLNLITIGRSLRSWDTFPHHPVHWASPLYLSEAGPRGFDAALGYQATKSGLEDSGRVALTDIFVASLFRLGLGWNSIFFRFNEQNRVFEKHIKDARISGISLTAVDGLIEEFLQCGTQVRKVRRFILATPTQTDLPTPLSSLACAASVLLHSFEEHVYERFKTDLPLLKTQMLFRRPACLLKVLVDIIENAENATTDGAVISSVFTKCDYYSHEFVWLSSVLRELMAMVAESWLSSVESWIGLRPEPQTLLEVNRNRKGFINTDEVHGQNCGRIEARLVDYSFRPEAMPIFVPAGYAETIFESGKSLRLLKEFHPNHPLSIKSGTSRSMNLALECAFTWKDIDKIQQKANNYEAQLRAEILRYDEVRLQKCSTLTSEDKNADTPVHEDHDPIDGVFSLFDLDGKNDDIKLLASHSSISSDRLHVLLTESNCFNTDEVPGNRSLFGPPLDASVYLSFAPVISAQTRLINFSCLHLLFKGHKIKEHLQLQWRFQLLGDGIFSSRLSHVLFDPEMHSGERKAGVARGGSSTGLRLGNRDTWPPASSELRLVLMGLLSESYHGDKNYIGQNTGNQVRNKELPGGLSFAIRELTGEELVKCKNPNSIEALDFLRLQYHPPSVLEAIITPRSLRRYDTIFKRLLRQIRMLSVARGLIRDSTDRSNTADMSRTITQKFRIEAHHFVQTVSDYSFHIAVGETWSKFERILVKIEKCIDKGDIDGTIDNAKSLHRLREYHEDVLDQILFALFVSKKHVQARKLIDDIFGTILTFSSISKAASTGTWVQQDGKPSYDRIVRQLFSVFRKQVSGFVRFLRALDGAKAMRSKGKPQDLAAWGIDDRAGVDTDSIFEHLLLRLDMNGFY
ncbi:gamma-tubulin complex component GCP6 [Blastomyces gilchristii SLH14081]|uniref:Spindle pole body component n=1 Tax=Blastomyces gilchristii (strain SLH14081) TaxID=559298 RepID=A0A179UBE5_BLAGS|nr:gamma-tubulin complex component GCP6 [Blastomyces gilchristii SLH14081]OAT04331.1 gamma-tubulin complex component GCP6 [Blastomyces gilchristii SLH14081]